MYKISRFWITMLIILAAIYFYFFIYQNTKENFTPRLNLFVRPHLNLL